MLEKRLGSRVYVLSHVQLCHPVDCIAHQASLSMEFPGRNTGVLSFPSPGHLPDPGVKPGLLLGRLILYHCAT